MPDLLLAEDGTFLSLESGLGFFAMEYDTGEFATGIVALRQDQSVNSYYDIGDVPLWTATFTSDGEPVSPTAVRFIVRTPSGTETVHDLGDDDVTTVSAGVYRLTAPVLTTNGVHWCRVVGTDPNTAAERPIGVRSRKTTS